MRPSNRAAILDAALRVLDLDGGAEISYEATARACGLTKAGVLYHFPSREELVRAVVAHAAGRWDAALRARLGRAPENAPAAERIRVYVEESVHADLSPADVAVFAEALYRPQHAAGWHDVFAPWFDLTGCEPGERARLSLARLAADGLWLARATGLFAPEDATGVLDEALALLGDPT